MAPWPGRKRINVKANNATVSAVRMKIRASMRVSNLDIDDLADPEESDQLHRDSHPHQDLSYRVGEENRHVAWIQHVKNREQNDRQGREEIAGHPALGGVDP